MTHLKRLLPGMRTLMPDALTGLLENLLTELAFVLPLSGDPFAALLLPFLPRLEQPPMLYVPGIVPVQLLGREECPRAVLALKGFGVGDGRGSVFGGEVFFQDGLKGSTKFLMVAATLQLEMNRF